MTTPEEQRTFRLLLRILSMAQFTMAVRAADPYRASELNALATYRPVAIGVAVVSMLALVGGLFSGVCIWRRRQRGLSQWVAAVSLLLFPIGTVIGLATLITLGQKPVRELYDASRSPEPSPRVSLPPLART
jgi:hypothetical protein